MAGIMHRIDFKAILIAFVAEFAVDILTVQILVMIFGRDLLDPGMSAEEVQKAIGTIFENGSFVLASFVCGTITTILGGYLAARLAKGFPYYNGLAIGVVGVVYVLFFAGDGPLWYTIVGVLLTIPLAIFGAHIARKRAPASE
jgi:hypothetical protein